MFTDAEYSWLRSVQESTMKDTCIVQTYAEGTQDSFGQPSSPIYTDGTPKICGFSWKGGSEDKTPNPEATVLRKNAELRLPYGTTVDPKDRIKITHRYGIALVTPLIFEIVSPIKDGYSGIVLDLEVITT